MSKQKATFWIEEGEEELLKEKFNTDNQSEAIRLAILQSLATEDLEKVKTLFAYVGKKIPRIGREVVNAFEQSGYEISDSDDAEAIALATLNMLDKLPNVCPNDAYWSLGQLVHRRDNIMKQRTRLVNQLHEQLHIAYPSYKSFFNDISRPTALYFWEHYPSRKYLKGKTVEELREELIPVSHNKCYTKTCEAILDAVAGDKVKNVDYQDARDMVTLSIVRDLQHYNEELDKVDEMLEKMYKELDCTLTIIPEVNLITAVKVKM